MKPIDARRRRRRWNEEEMKEEGMKGERMKGEGMKEYEDRKGKKEIKKEKTRIDARWRKRKGKGGGETRTGGR